MIPAREEMHRLLPWFVNSTLEKEESESFEKHLATCGDCKREIEMLQALRKVVEQHGEAFFGPHPDPRILVEVFFEGGTDPPAELSRHLALCSTCTAEVEILTRSREGSESRDPVVSAPSPARSRRIALPLAAAAAILLAVAVSILWIQGSSSIRTDVVPAHYLEPPQRAPAGNVVRVAREAASFQLVVPADPGDPRYPVSLRISDASGRIILRRSDLGPAEHYQGRFFFIHCDASDFPEGEYSVLLAAGAGIDQEITFRVERP